MKMTDESAICFMLPAAPGKDVSDLKLNRMRRNLSSSEIRASADQFKLLIHKYLFAK